MKDKLGDATFTRLQTLWDALTVRRQGFWDQWLPKLRGSLAHLVGLIMRRASGFDGPQPEP